MDELDALLGDLGKGLTTGGSGSARLSTAPRAQQVVTLRNNPTPSTQSRASGGTAAAAPRPTSGLEDLDSLITQLGGIGSPSPAVASPSQRKPAAAPAAAPAPAAGSRVHPTADVSDIDALMASLSLPAGGGGAPAVANAHRAPIPATAPASTSSSGDGLLSDIDALMASLGPSSAATGAPNGAPRSSGSPYPAGSGARPGVGAGRGGAAAASPAASRFSAAQGSPVARGGGGGGADDLDAILNSLQVDSRTVPAAHQPPTSGGSPYGGGLHQQQPPMQQKAPGSGGFPPQQHSPAAAPRSGGVGGGMPGMRPPGSGGAPAAQVPKGSCGTCQRPIQGPMMQALGRTYHPNCFVCANCGDSLGSGTFYQTDGNPTCARCYQAQFCARCAHCSQPIQGQCISALNKQWHVNCFICSQCLKPFGTAPYFEREGNPFCEGCFYGIFSSRCAGCDQPIKADTVNACGKQWHPECFVCSHCRRAFAGQPYFDYGGRPYCQLHYHSQIGAACGCGCGRPIMGRVVQALGKQWLPEHFLCGFCMNSLAGQNFTQRDGKAYCNGCFGKIFAT